MKTRIGGSRRARQLALRIALWTCTGSMLASAQPSPTPPPPSAPAPVRPPPGAGPDESTPPPLATSPMLGGEAPPPPVPPTDETTTPPPPTYEPTPPPAPPEEPPPPRRSAGPFSRGSVRLSVLIGSGWTATDQYLILGAGVGYYLVDGLELGLDWEAWLFGSPVLNRLSPGIKYVFHMVPVIKPYVGGFYRHTFVNNYEDFNYLGARAGVIYAPKGGGVYVGGGAVYEHLLNCNKNLFADCDDVYPEISIGISIGR